MKGGFVGLLVLSSLSLPVFAAITIDDFEDNQSFSDSLGGMSTTDTVPLTGVAASTRAVTLDAQTGASGVIDFETKDCSNDPFTLPGLPTPTPRCGTYSAESGINGPMTIVWQLGGADLTGGGDDLLRFHLNFEDQQGTLDVTVSDGMTSATYPTINLPGLPGTPLAGWPGQNFDMPYATFSDPSVFSNVQTITFVFNFTLAATDMEVDILETANGTPDYDWGDNPDTPYGTLVGSNGPRHQITENLYLGVFVDQETDGQPSVGADGDDTNSTPRTPTGTQGDDEDGLNPAQLSLVRGAVPTLDVTVTNNTGSQAMVICWVDYDDPLDGFDTDGSESDSALVNDGFSGPVQLTLPVVPATAPDNSYARCRLTTNAAFISTPSPTGLVDDGEIEDYPVTIADSPVQYDLGDNPDDNYHTTTGMGGPRHQIVTNLYLGSCVDSEADGQPSVGSDGDDIGAASAVTEGTCARANDDEDGVDPNEFSLTPGDNPVLNITVFNNTGGNANLACWVDYDGSRTYEEMGERGDAVVSSSASPQVVMLSMPQVPDPAATLTYARCRLTTDTMANAEGNASDGEVEDYRLGRSISLVPVFGAWGYVMLALLLTLLGVARLRARS